MLDALLQQQADVAAAASAPQERVRTEVAAPVIVKRADDPRLRRLAGVDREEAVAERRQIRSAEIVRRGREVSSCEGYIA